MPFWKNFLKFYEKLSTIIKAVRKVASQLSGSVIQENWLIKYLWIAFIYLHDCENECEYVSVYFLCLSSDEQLVLFFAGMNTMCLHAQRYWTPCSHSLQYPKFSFTENCPLTALQQKKERLFTAVSKIGSSRILWGRNNECLQAQHHKPT